MSRLVAVSNRISVPKRGSAPGGLAVGLLAAMQARRGLRWRKVEMRQGPEHLTMGAEKAWFRRPGVAKCGQHV